MTRPSATSVLSQRLLQAEAAVPAAIATVLEQAGIDMVFGMPGGNTIRFFDAFYDRRAWR